MIPPGRCRRRPARPPARPSHPVAAAAAQPVVLMRRRFSGAALAPLFALLASVTCNDGPTQPKVRVGSLVLRDVLDLDVGRTGRLTAVVTDPEGEPLPASVLAWSSSDEAVATVDGDGTITGRAQGRLWVRASAGGHLDSAGVYVWRPA